MLSLRFHGAARLEIRALAPQLGQSFTETVDHCLRGICQLPFAWQPWPGADGVRRRPLQRWPYSIIYAVEPAAIFVVAIAHQRRRPGYWMSRL